MILEGDRARIRDGQLILERHTAALRERVKEHDTGTRLMISESLFRRFYFDPKFDGTQRFFEMVWRDARPDARVLNLGAGPATGDPIRSLKAK